MTISFDLFSRIMTHIAAIHKLENTVSDAFLAYNKATRDCSDCGMWPSILESDLVLLLEYMTNDEDSWISYWLYELNCGEKYVEGSILDENDNPIPCKTLEDLYSLILSYNE